MENDYTARDQRKPVIRVRDLSKSFGKHQVLSAVTFEIAPGEVVGLVGPNGAGKTTLLLAMMGFLEFDHGEIVILDQAVRCGATPRGVSYIPDRPEFYDFCTPVSQLRLAARLLGKDASEQQIVESLSRAGLAANGQRIWKLSRGMNQRLAWAQAILAGQKILLLDEPTSALDPQGVIALREVIVRAKEEGAAILFSSHSLAEVERISTRVLFLVGGKLSDWVSTQQSGSFRYEIILHPQSTQNLEQLSSKVDSISTIGRRIEFTLKQEALLDQVLSLISSCGLQVIHISAISSSLENSLIERLQEPK